MVKKILYSFSLYTLTSVICALLSILILPFLTKYLSEKDYGTTALFSTYVLILSPVISLSSGGFFWLEFFKRQRDNKQMSTLFSTYFWLIVGCTLIVSLICLGVFPLIKDFSFFALSFVMLIPATSLVSVIGEETRNYFVNHKQPLSYMVYSVSITLVELSLSYYFVVYVYKSWEGRIFAWCISLFIQFIIAVWFFGAKQKYIRFTFSKADFFKLALFGYPLIFHQLGKFVINQSDRLFIANMISIDEAGIYSVGYQVGSMMLLPITAFANFYTPFVYERLTRITELRKVEIVKTSYAFFAVMVLCFFGVLTISPYFFRIFIDPKFHKGMDYVFWVALSYLFWGIYLLLTSVVFYKGKTKFLGGLSVFNMILNCLFNVLFIKAYGAIGAAYATALSFFVMLLIIVFYSSLLMPLPWFFFMKKGK